MDKIEHMIRKAYDQRDMDSWISCGICGAAPTHPYRDAS